MSQSQKSKKNDLRERDTSGYISILFMLGDSQIKVIGYYPHVKLEIVGAKQFRGFAVKNMILVLLRIVSECADLLKDTSVNTSRRALKLSGELSMKAVFTICHRLGIRGASHWPSESIGKCDEVLQLEIFYQKDFAEEQH